MPQGKLRAIGDCIGAACLISPKRYFGGNMKGGAAPSATGFMIASGRRGRMATSAHKPNFLFRMKTGPGPSPFGYGPYAGGA